MISIRTNRKDYKLDVTPNTPLLWLLRANPIFAATGKRVRRLPILRKDLVQALL